jgi:hypothetical protein
MSKKKVLAVSDATPIIQTDDIMMPEDIASFCSMIITGVTDGKVNKTGLITSKEKLEKLKKLENVTVIEGDFEAVKIRGHETIAVVNTDRVVTVRKPNNNETKEESNNEINKENEIMENNENKVVNAEIENKENKTETAAAPVAEPQVQVPTDQLDAEARAELGKTVSEKIKAGEVTVVAHTRVVTNKQLAVEAAWTVGGIAAGFLVCLGLSKLFGRD